MALVTLPDLCCCRGLCSAPRLQAGALLIESGPAWGACSGAHSASEFTYINCRQRKLDSRLGAPCYSAPSLPSVFVSAPDTRLGLVSGPNGGPVSMGPNSGHSPPLRVGPLSSADESRKMDTSLLLPRFPLAPWQNG